MARYTQSYLTKLEDLFKNAGYKVRYEKGNFKSGYCILEDKKVIVINKFVEVETKINFFMNIVEEVKINVEELDEENQQIYQSIISKEKQN